MQPISAWNVTTIVHFRLGGKKGQFLIYKATYLYFQMYSSLEGKLSGHPMSKWLDGDHDSEASFMLHFI